MTRLIVTDGEQRRAFRVREGKLTIGSGATCTLRLTASNVAEVHAELELRDGRVTLTPRPGVMPPTLDGRELSGPTELPEGARVSIGGAELQVRPDDQEGKGAAAQPAARPKPVAKAPGAATGARPARGAAQPKKGTAKKLPRVQASRPLHEVKRGTPVPLILLGFAVALVVLVALGSKFWKKGATGFNPTARYNAALNLYNQGEHSSAELELAKLDGVTLPPDLRSKVKALRKDLSNVDAVREQAQNKERGSEYMDTQLIRFEKERLQGEPAREVVRVFLMRCEHFRKTWPDHPDIGWVDRHQSRFRGYVNLAEPPTFKDIKYEIKTLTWAMPRDYLKAFFLIEDFIENGQENERELAVALKVKLNEDRDAYFLDRMQQAAWLWEREKQGEAVEWLVQLIMKVGDDEMEAEAAREMVALPGIEEWLEGYKRSRPEKFELIMEEKQVREFAREHDLL
jgi:pSer/pThr/pTyr-binding forkhead associated (FHA) protein